MKDYNDFNMKFFNTNSMKLYNHNNGVILFCLIFLFWAYSYGKDCPCSTNTTCIRVEFYGVQLNHFILFIILYTWIIISFLFLHFPVFRYFMGVC